MPRLATSEGISVIMTQNPQPDPTFPAYPPIDNSSATGAGYPPPPAGQPTQPPYGAPSPDPSRSALGDVTGSGPMTPQQERTWAMLAHLVPLALFILSAGTFGFVASLVIYLMYKDRGPFVRQNAANSLNIQIAMGIGVVISWILIATIILIPVGIIGLVAVAVWGCVLHAIAAGKANQGQWYTPPATPTFVR